MRTCKERTFASQSRRALSSGGSMPKISSPGAKFASVLRFVSVKDRSVVATSVLSCSSEGMASICSWILSLSTRTSFMNSVSDERSWCPKRALHSLSLPSALLASSSFNTSSDGLSPSSLSFDDSLIAASYFERVRKVASIVSILSSYPDMSPFREDVKSIAAFNCDMSFGVRSRFVSLLERTLSSSSRLASAFLWKRPRSFSCHSTLCLTKAALRDCVSSFINLTA
mmetsp:Transcript_462/g.1411  ORF Transcript_462/g.1411 Transcript_462/m.1411 type:complete len:227 (+) Transcript_462:905-1585(+)